MPKARPPRCTYSQHCTIPGHGPACTREHVEPPPDPRHFTWPVPVMHYNEMNQIIYSNWRDVEPSHLTPNYRYFRGDSFVFRTDLDWLYEVMLWGRAIQLQGSPEVPVINPEVLPEDTPIRRYTDSTDTGYPAGLPVIQGQTGQCDNQSALFLADKIAAADYHRVGLDFAGGLLWQYAPRGHSPNWCIDLNGFPWVVQVGKTRTRETFVIDPTQNPDWLGHMIYEA